MVLLSVGKTILPETLMSSVNWVSVTTSGSHLRDLQALIEQTIKWRSGVALRSVAGKVMAVATEPKSTDDLMLFIFFPC